MKSAYRSHHRMVKYLRITKSAYRSHHRMVKYLCITKSAYRSHHRMVKYLRITKSAYRSHHRMVKYLRTMKSAYRSHHWGGQIPPYHEVCVQESSPGWSNTSVSRSLRTGVITGMVKYLRITKSAYRSHHRMVKYLRITKSAYRSHHWGGQIPPYHEVCVQESSPGWSNTSVSRSLRTGVITGAVKYLRIMKSAYRNHHRDGQIPPYHEVCVQESSPDGQIPPYHEVCVQESSPDGQIPLYHEVCVQESSPDGQIPPYHEVCVQESSPDGQIPPYHEVCVQESSPGWSNTSVSRSLRTGVITGWSNTSVSRSLGTAVIIEEVKYLRITKSAYRSHHRMVKYLRIMKSAYGSHHRDGQIPPYHEVCVQESSPGWSNTSVSRSLRTGVITGMVKYLRITKSAYRSHHRNGQIPPYHEVWVQQSSLKRSNTSVSRSLRTGVITGMVKYLRITKSAYRSHHRDGQIPPYHEVCVQESSPGWSNTSVSRSLRTGIITGMVKYLRITKSAYRSHHRNGQIPPYHEVCVQESSQEWSNTSVSRSLRTGVITGMVKYLRITKSGYGSHHRGGQIPMASL